MDADALRAFASRDWEAIAASKRRHWAHALRSRGPEALFQVALRLRDHARALQPDWPTAHERARDLADHIELKQLLDRAAHAGSTG
ncbi:hypothetical protein L6Q96_02925 [Candidatus Binatia bacterium]|nr:hypothetical protein [Candidatus Binatia bacterium]